MTIKEVEEELNVTRANVRFYEKEGLLTARRNCCLVERQWQYCV